MKLTAEEYELVKKHRENKKHVGIHKGLPSEPSERYEPDAGIEEQLEKQERDNHPTKAGDTRETKKPERLEVEEIKEAITKAETEHECSGCGSAVSESMDKCPKCGEELDWENIEE